jgi:hypothetical protein
MSQFFRNPLLRSADTDRPLRGRLGLRVDDRLEGRRVLDGLLERLDRGRGRFRLGLLLLLLALGGLRRSEELRERALTHAGALSRH